MENIDYTKNSSNETSETSPFISEDNPDFQNQNNYTSFPHKGIFHPEPNIFICKSNCCCKYLGLFIFLYGSFIGVLLPAIGISKNNNSFIILGPVVFLGCLILGILVFYCVTIEVKFTFSYPMIEITTSSIFITKSKLVGKSEISEIFFEYREIRNNGFYQALHIKFNNGSENRYFNFNSNPPCFTKNEVDFFNNEMKKYLSSDYNYNYNYNTF